MSKTCTLFTTSVAAKALRNWDIIGLVHEWRCTCREGCEGGVVFARHVNDLTHREGVAFLPLVSFGDPPFPVFHVDEPADFATWLTDPHICAEDRELFAAWGKAGMFKALLTFPIQAPIVEEETN